MPAPRPPLPEMPHLPLSFCDGRQTRVLYPQPFPRSSAKMRRKWSLKCPALDFSRPRDTLSRCPWREGAARLLRAQVLLGREHPRLAGTEPSQATTSSCGRPRARFNPVPRPRARSGSAPSSGPCPLVPGGTWLRGGWRPESISRPWQLMVTESPFPGATG